MTFGVLSGTMGEKRERTLCSGVIEDEIREGGGSWIKSIAVKYLKTFGFHINHDAFAAHSWYFRNALVRANYNDLTRGIHVTTEYLEYFFGNLLLGTEHELKNRYLVIDETGS